MSPLFRADTGTDSGGPVSSMCSTIQQPLSEGVTDAGQKVEYLSSIHKKALDLIPRPPKTTVVHAYSPSTQEVEAGGSGGQGHPWFYNEFKASLGKMFSLKIKQNHLLTESPVCAKGYERCQGL